MITFIFLLLSILNVSGLHFSRVHLDIGENIGDHVKDRLLSHIHAVTILQVIEHYDDFISLRTDEYSLMLALGNSSYWLNIGKPSLAKLQPEGFAMISEWLNDRTMIISSNGLPLEQSRHKNISFDARRQHYGAIVGAYAALEEIGFGFLHPLAPSIPHRLSIPSHTLNIHENPYWPERSFHLHTQHPLELTEVLQGHDIPMFGPQGPQCEQHYRRSKKAILNSFSSSEKKKERIDFTYCERWEDMVDDVDSMFEWTVANRLNKVEWLLLGSFRWGDLDNSEHRMRRLEIITTIGHSYSLLVGADVPLGNIQQHAWHMVNVRLPFDQQVRQIKDRVDWVFHAGFDFLTTESGMSEFTHPECDLMLDLMNAYAKYVNNTWGREAAVKVHCSSQQVCDDFLDPRTGEPINFNFLPTFADPALGVFPHTVQMYSLDDPTAGSYGNENFRLIEDYMHYEAGVGNRSVVYYGETSYWVNLDIDVPLFLPLYGQRRLYDLRRIARRELESGNRIDGQMNFDSGWEWGYWISNVVTARASWNPLTDNSYVPMSNNTTNDESVTCSKTPCSHVQLANLSEEEKDWKAFQIYLSVVSKVFSETAEMQAIGTKFVELIIVTSKIELELLILGRINNTLPSSKKLSGIAYLCGTDTWVDLPRMFGIHLTQPDKVHLHESQDPDWLNVSPLLIEMQNQFKFLSVEAHELLKEAEYLASSCMTTDSMTTDSSCSTNPIGGAQFDGIAILREVVDGLELLALRSKQVRILYESTNEVEKTDKKVELLKESRETIANASAVVSRREKSYHVPWQRIASWRENPTVYRYGYLWAVHSLYYWWRDQGLAEGLGTSNPCYLNRMDASEVAVGWGKYSMELVRNLIDRYLPFSSTYALDVMNCFVPPQKEFLFPEALDQAIQIYVEDF